MLGGHGTKLPEFLAVLVAFSHLKHDFYEFYLNIIVYSTSTYIICSISMMIENFF